MVDKCSPTAVYRVVGMYDLGIGDIRSAAYGARRLRSATADEILDTITDFNVVFFGALQSFSKKCRCERKE